MKGKREGDRFTVRGEGEFVIKRILNTVGGNCLASVQDSVIASRVTEQQPTLTPVILPSPAAVNARSAAERLRDLKKLREENLISQEVYDAKQRDILSGQ